MNGGIFFLNYEWSPYNTCFEIVEKKVHAGKCHDIEVIPEMKFLYAIWSSQDRRLPSRWTLCGKRHFGNNFAIKYYYIIFRFNLATYLYITYFEFNLFFRNILSVGMGLTINRLYDKISRSYLTEQWWWP